MDLFMERSSEMHDFNYNITPVLLGNIKNYIILWLVWDVIKFYNRKTPVSNVKGLRKKKITDLSVV